MSTTIRKKKLGKKHTKKKLSRLKDLEKIASDLDAIARRHLPDNVIRHGILKGYEAEIRQEALIKVVGGFLQGNVSYQLAAARKDEDGIRMAMEQCMAISLSIVKTRIASRLSHEFARIKGLTEENGGTWQHPSQTKPCGWSADVKTVMIMRSVAKAVHQGRLSIANASIVSMICERGMAAEEVALHVGITKSAVYQQVWRVRSVLPEVMEQIEIPFL